MNLVIGASLFLLSFFGGFFSGQPEEQKQTFTFAAPSINYQRSLIPIDSTENIGTTSAPWDEGHFNEICLSADCKTAWPTGGSGSFPFSADTNFAQVVYSTSTPTLWFKSGLFASSTSWFTNTRTTNATSTNHDITGLFTFNGVTGDQWTDFCTTITGGADLCDGNDASGGSGAGSVATSTGETAGNLAYWTSTNATPALLGKVATSSLTINSPLTTSGTAGYLVGGSGFTIDIDDIQAADLDLTDITLNDFTNDANFITLSSLSATWPIQYNSGTGTFTWGGLATTSNPTAGNIFYSNGTNGLIPIATSSINVGTASALFANGANCSSGNAPLGVDASGAVESCFDVWTEAENTVAAYTPQSRTLTVAGTANQITSSAGAQDLSANRTWTLSLPSHVIFPGNFQATNATTTNATSTGTLYVTGAFASTTNFFANGLSTCTGDNYLTWSAGVFGCDTDDSGSGSGGFDFSYLQDIGYGITGSATSTKTKFMVGIHASSTSHFSNATTSLFTNTGATWLPSLTSALVLAGSDGLLAEYAGTSCTNQFIRSLNGSGVATCEDVTLATDTTGNFVATVTSSGSITVGNSGTENAAVTVNLNMGNANSWTALQTFANSSTTLGSFNYASSTLYYGAGLADCNTGNMLTWTSGRFGCEADDEGAGGGTFAWTPTTNFGAAANSTSTPIWFTAGLQASSTSHLSTTTISGSHLQFGERIYPTTSYPQGTNSYLIIDKGGTPADASIVLRDQGNARAELGIFESNQLIFKTVTGTYGSETFTSRFTIRNDTGWIGVGTEQPSSLFEIASTSPGERVDLRITNKATSGTDGSMLSLVAENDGYIFYVGTDAGANGNQNAFLNFGAFGTGLFIDSAGKVGINTTSLGGGDLTVAYASTTAITVSGTASSTGLVVSGLNAANCDVKASTSGVLSCGTDSEGSAVFPFTTTTNFGQTVNATTTALWMQGTPFSLFASSTAVFSQASTTRFSIFDNLYLHNTTDSTDVTAISFDGSQVNYATNIDLNGSSLFAAENVRADQLELTTAQATTGVRLSAADGVLTMLGMGNGNDENLTFDFDNASANVVSVNTGTGVTQIDWNAIGFVTTGSIDFGGASSLEIPNGANPTVDAIGEIALDTTYNELLIATSTNASFPGVIPLEQKIWGRTMASTSVDFVSGGRLPLPPVNTDWTITKIICVVDGGTSVVLNLDTLAGGANTTSATCGTSRTSQAISANTSVASTTVYAQEFGTVTGAVDYLTFSVWGYPTRH